MTNLLDVLASSPALQWRIARVKRIVPGPPYYVDLVMGGTTELETTIGSILGAAVLESYVPALQDIVHVLVHTSVGALVLGPAREVPQAPEVELPRVSQFYSGNAPYNITSIDNTAKQNLGGTTMTNPDATRYILARGDCHAWGSVGAGNAGYLSPLVTGATGSIYVGDSRIENDEYTSQHGAMYFTIAPKATVTFRGTAHRASTESPYSVNYLRVSIAAINWRPNGSI